MTLERVPIRFYLEASPSGQDSNGDLDRLLVNYLSSLPAKARHEWVLSALRAASLMVLAGGSPGDALLSLEEQKRFRQLGNVLRAMGQDEDFAQSITASSGQRESSALSSSQPHPSAMSVRDDGDRRDLVEGDNGSDDSDQSMGEGSGDAVSAESLVPDAPVPLSPLKERLRQL